MCRIYSFVFLSCLMLAIQSCDTEKNKPIPPPNILWIVSEDNGPFLGCYGDTFATTPHLDALAKEGILYERFYATSPVCAPARSSIITGMFPTSLGTQHMRSNYQIPDFVEYFPKHLRQKGYYTSNKSKEDYNTSRTTDCWDESSETATYRNRKKGQAFFAIFNYHTTHESCIHTRNDTLLHPADQVSLPPYHPDTKAMREDWAQYYDQVQKIDEEVGQLLAQLEDDGLADSTIVFYYSDHGGVLGRSKRFLYESGLHVPLIIRVPELYQHLFEEKVGSRNDRLASFVDLAPTVLSLADIPIPDYMQGQAFAGKQKTPSPTYVFSARGRMDERVDLSRSITDGRYRYTRHYMPHRPLGQYLEYLYRAPSMQSWKATFDTGETNEVQSAYFKKKSFEELFDLKKDPHNITNLANSTSHQEILNQMRNALDVQLLTIEDCGFMTEASLIQLMGDSSVYQYTHAGHYDLTKVQNAANIAAQSNAKNLNQLIEFQKSSNPHIRYWGAMGCVILADQAAAAKDQLLLLLEDTDPSVRIAAAEALYLCDASSATFEKVKSTFEAMLNHEEMIVRMMAHNPLEFYDDLAKALLPTLQKIKRPKKDRAYDNRGFVRLVEKLVN